MEFLSISQFLWQLFNFLLFYLVVSRYVVPPVQKMIAKRQSEIEAGLEFSQKAKAELEASQKKREEILKQARSEAQVIVEDGKKRAEALIESAKSEAVVAARQEAAQIVASAEQELDKRRAQVDKEVVELALAVVEKSFKKTLGNSHDLVAKELAGLSKVKEYVS